MKNKSKISLIILIIGLIILPVLIFAGNAQAATAKAKFYYGGWMPFWKIGQGAAQAALNLDKLDEISPFSYEVKSDGSLVDKLKIATDPFWTTWLPAVHDNGTKIIPTIAWFDGQGIDNLLSSSKKRIAHENSILKLVKTNKFDGIDIDYESKLAQTKDNFSTFIYGLAIRLHPLGKKLACTIESRIPPTSRLSYTGTDQDTTYANDYVALNKYCDEVRIMAYDQGIIDINLDLTKGSDGGNLYAPVADPDWVQKILTEAMKTISPKKIMLGIPTYGYEYQVTWNNGIITYDRLRSHTYTQAMQRAADVHATPTRNNAGELSFTYATSSYFGGTSPGLTWNLGSTETLPAAIFSIGHQLPVTRYVTFSDAVSAKQKIDLAKKNGLRGVVFFKIDGETDPALWSDIVK